MPMLTCVQISGSALGPTSAIDSMMESTKPTAVGRSIIALAVISGNLADSFSSK